MPRQYELDRPRAWLHVWGPILSVIAIVATPLIVSGLLYHFEWIGKCTGEAKQTVMTCALVGLGLVAGSAFAMFTLVVLVWWMTTDLHGLKRLFEVPWAGLDDEEVDTVDGAAAVGRAALIMFVFLLGLFVGILSIAGVFNKDTIPLFERKPQSQQNQKGNDTKGNSSASNRRNTLVQDLRFFP